METPSLQEWLATLEQQTGIGRDKLVGFWAAERTAMEASLHFNWSNTLRFAWWYIGVLAVLLAGPAGASNLGAFHNVFEAHGLRTLGEIYLVEGLLLMVTLGSALRGQLESTEESAKNVLAWIQVISAHTFSPPSVRGRGIKFRKFVTWFPDVFLVVVGAALLILDKCS